MKESWLDKDWFGAVAGCVALIVSLVIICGPTAVVLYFTFRVLSKLGLW